MNILTLIGSIGLFLFAMQLISESLQKLAGDPLRHILPAVKGNVLMGMLTGLGVTALVQSSSAVTVMAVSFVNSGLITLAQSMAMIMGANIGTTITGWIIAGLGFGFAEFNLAFPLAAFALLFFSSRSSRVLSISELILGFSLFFISLSAMQTSFAVLDGNWLQQLLSSVGLLHWVTVFAVMICGLVFTLLVRSSSAAFALFLLMCSNGWISFELACALIVIANIGTCLPPILASRQGNAMAHRAAFWHLLFNCFGMVWALLLLLLCSSLLSDLFVSIGLDDPHTPTGAPLSLALFHTLFNLVTTCLLLPFTHRLANNVAGKMDVSNVDEPKAFKLQFLSSGLISSGELALVQVRKETSRYSEETYQMFLKVRSMLAEPLGSERQLQLNDEIRQLEEESDNAEVEIADFLNKISPKSLSQQGEMLSRNLYKIVDELESIADSVYHISATLYAKSEQRVRFSNELNASITKMFDLTDNALQHMVRVLAMEDVPANALNKAYNFEDEINNFRNMFRNAVLDQFDRQELEFQQSTFFMILINDCEKIGDYVINVVTAACER